MFWLSHHHPQEWNRTYSIGGVRVCARCLGTYPMLVVAIALQLALHAPLVWAGDLPWALVLTLPALIDWARGRFDPHRGHNAVRTITGLLLGLALGRTLYVHLREPWPWGLRAQLALVLAVALPTVLLVSRRKHG